jgi:hypothetical protein
VNVGSKNTKPLLVLNSVLEPDTAAVVQVSKSVSAFDGSSPTVIVDAALSLWEDGKFLMNCTNNGNGFYSTNYKPLVGHSYTFKAHENGMTDVDATTSIPPLSEVSIVSVDTVAEDLTIQLNDPNGANYYSFELYSVDPFGTTTNIQLYTDNTALLDNSKSPAFSFGRHGNRKLHRIPNYIGDELFNGQSNQYVLSFNTDNGFHGGSHGGPSIPQPLPPGSYYLKVYNVSSEIYKYFKTVNGAADPNPFAEPTQIFSNVNNGLGVVGCINYQKLFVLKK